MNKYKNELQGILSLRGIGDRVQYSVIDTLTGCEFIGTAGHGYLVVPKESAMAHIADKICNCGFKGKLAFYLEEDCEYIEFAEAIKNQ